MGQVKDITGKKFGMLTVLRQDGFAKPNKHGSRYAMWFCKCDCGNYCRMDTGTIKKPGNHSTQSDKAKCPMIRYCLARLNDRTITGCGIPLYSAGLIRREEIQVEHTVKAAKMEAVKC